MRATCASCSRSTRDVLILLLGGDKTGQWQAWYETAIPRADALLDEYLDELRREGLL
jgi:hypothetical protein